MSRRTNIALLVFLILAGASGAASYAVGVPSGAFVAISHGAFGLGLLLLAPWKSLIVRRGITRDRPRAGRWASIFLLLAVSISIVFGFLHSSGLAVNLGPVSSMQIHVGTALVAVPAAIWHVIARPQRLHKADLNRRNFLRAGALVAGTAGLYAAVEGGIRLGSLSGAIRRFTGSHESEPLITSWLNDRIPLIDAEAWRLTVGTREWSYAELLQFDDRLETVLDCTGGWYAQTSWRGARLGRLLGPTRSGRGIYVTSVTGYSRRFPMGRIDSLFVATKMNDEQLPPGHGYPARLVVPGRRGFWWVKWISEIGVDNKPAWLQSPFPLT